MILFIDTTLDDRCTVALYDGEGMRIAEREVFIPAKESEYLLKMIHELKGSHIIEGIVVIQTGGRFSALRTGIACAHALAYAWNVPVVGVDRGEDIALIIRGLRSHAPAFGAPVVPQYASKPNITIAKKD
jgi:tRNA A37 threonylcarbamoyladenosine modification protein TsaB